MNSRVTISITSELDAALEVAAFDRSMNKSRLVETLLREHEALRKPLQEVRAEANFYAYAAGSRVREAARASSVKAASASEAAAATSRRIVRRRPS